MDFVITTYSYPLNRGKTWLKLYKTYIKPSLLYACEAWRPNTLEGVEKLEGVQRRVLRMAGGQGVNYREACRKAGLNTIQEELDEADMVRTFRIMYGHDKLDKKVFWKMEEARPGAGRRRFREKEVKRTIADQRKAIRKNSFASRVQDPWNKLEDSVKLCKTPKAFRKAYRRAKHLV